MENELELKDIILRSSALLNSIIETLQVSKEKTLAQSYANEYNKILERLEKVKINCNDFQLSSEDVRERWNGSIGDQNFYTKPEIDREVLLIKARGLLKYLEYNYQQFFKK